LASKRFRSIKPEIRVLGIDDGQFIPKSNGFACVVGIVYRGGYCFDGVMWSEITIDGLDATEKIIEMIKKSPHYRGLRVVILDGITFAGFNVLDLNELSRVVDLPAISVARKKPDLEKMRNALKNLPDFKERWQTIRNAGEIFEIENQTGENPIYIQMAGISLDEAKIIINKTSTRSNIPEALRVAHIVASGLSCR
jgi:endonuclease V-like protein UPF0215 family